MRCSNNRQHSNSVVAVGKGSVAVAEMLQDKAELMKLDLSDNYIGVEGA